MREKHLELIQKDTIFLIQINTLVGRLALLFDHPFFNFKLAKDFSTKHFQTRGRIRLIPLRRKDLFIMEDIDATGFKAQNFIYVSSELSEQFSHLLWIKWFANHFFEFVTKSISVFYILLYLSLNHYVNNRFGTLGTIQLGFLFGPPGMIVLSGLYYGLWSSRTKSSILKFFFRFELMMMLVAAAAYIAIYTIMRN